MKAIVLVLLLSVAFTHYTELEKVTLFNEWQLIQNKVYPNEDIEYFRFQAFSKNLDLIEQMKEQNPDAQFAMNQFADLTNEEFSSLYFGFIPDEEVQEENTISPIPNDVPENWDWVKEGAVTGVKNQGQCGSCWAFSTTGNLEGQNFLKNKKLIPLSEQQLVDCDTVDQGCNGGLMDNAFTWLKEHGGIESESDYTYRGIRQKCKFDKSKAVVQVTGFNDIAKGDEGAMVDSLYNHGPLAVAIHANGLQLYSGGIFDPIYCSKQLNHGVLGVGYGVDGNKNFWKIKNSWGSGWGERGYFRIIRGKNMCGLANAVSTADVQ